MNTKKNAPGIKNSSMYQWVFGLSDRQINQIKREIRQARFAVPKTRVELFTVLTRIKEGKMSGNQSWSALAEKLYGAGKNKRAIENEARQLRIFMEARLGIMAGQKEAVEEEAISPPDQVAVAGNKEGIPYGKFLAGIFKSRQKEEMEEAFSKQIFEQQLIPNLLLLICMDVELLKEAARIPVVNAVREYANVQGAQAALAPNAHFFYLCSKLLPHFPKAMNPMEKAMIFEQTKKFFLDHEGAFSVSERKVAVYCINVLISKLQAESPKFDRYREIWEWHQQWVAPEIIAYAKEMSLQDYFNVARSRFELDAETKTETFSETMDFLEKNEPMVEDKAEAKTIKEWFVYLIGEKKPGKETSLPQPRHDPKRLVHEAFFQTTVLCTYYDNRDDYMIDPGDKDAIEGFLNFFKYNLTTNRERIKSKKKKGSQEIWDYFAQFNDYIERLIKLRLKMDEELRLQRREEGMKVRRQKRMKNKPCFSEMDATELNRLKRKLQKTEKVTQILWLRKKVDELKKELYNSPKKRDIKLRWKRLYFHL